LYADETGLRDLNQNMGVIMKRRKREKKKTDCNRAYKTGKKVL